MQVSPKQNSVSPGCENVSCYFNYKLQWLQWNTSHSLYVLCVQNPK